MANKNVTLQSGGDNLYPQTKIENITDISSLNVNALSSGAATSGQVPTANGSGGIAWSTPSTGMTNPMTTQGDLIVGGTSGAADRLGIGTNGQVLTSNGTTASWQTPSAGTTYTAGTGIDVTNDEISIADYPVITLSDSASTPITDSALQAWFTKGLPFVSAGDVYHLIQSPGSLINGYASGITIYGTRNVVAYNKQANQFLQVETTPIPSPGVTYLTTAPSSANTDGFLKFVVLSSEPATKYRGYVYIITGA